MQVTKVFHSCDNTLGEGLFIDKVDRRVFWTDITGFRVYAKRLDAERFDTYDVDGYPSAILGVNGPELLFCNREGICKLDLDTGGQTVKFENPDTCHVAELRANDGVALDHDRFIYGTMALEPEADAGGLYLYDGKTTTSLDTRLGIPNGFVRLSNSDILIADSLSGKVNLYQLDADNRMLRFVSCWHDFSSSCFTPDGGCADHSGNVYFALWDGSRIAVLDYSGNFVETIDLPVPRPTNCKLVDSKRLLVTTAREGLSREQLQKAPLSGSVLEVQLR